MADLEILIEGVDNKATSILDFIDTNGPEVFVNLLVEFMETDEGWLDPVTKALLRDDMIVLGVPSFDEASVNVLQEKSVGLVVGKLWSITLWAILSLLKHTHEWITHGAGINGTDGGKCQKLVHLYFKN